MVPPMGFHVVGVRVMVPGKQTALPQTLQQIANGALPCPRVHINARTPHQRWQCTVSDRKTALLRAPLHWTLQLEAVFGRSTAAPKPDTATLPESWAQKCKLSLPCHQSPSHSVGLLPGAICIRNSNLYSTARITKGDPTQDLIYAMRP